jgi:hypothetical protein
VFNFSPFLSETDFSLSNLIATLTNAAKFSQTTSQRVEENTNKMGFKKKHKKHKSEKRAYDGNFNIVI